MYVYKHYTILWEMSCTNIAQLDIDWKNIKGNGKSKMIQNLAKNTA